MIDADGDILDILVQTRRNAKAAKLCLAKPIAQFGQPRIVITDKSRSYSKPIRSFAPVADHRAHKGPNTRIEGSHRPTRRREKIMGRFKSPKQAQRFLTVHDQINAIFKPAAIASLPTAIVMQGQIRFAFGTHMPKRSPHHRSGSGCFQTVANDLAIPFRPISRNDDPLERRLSPDGISQIFQNRLEAAGFPKGFATAYALRSGFLTQAALDGAPIQAAMRLSLHRSLARVQKYDDDADIVDNPARDLLG